MRDASSAEAGFSAVGRFKAIWQLKLGATMVLSVIFWTGYLYLSRNAFFTLHELPMTWLDIWAGYRPQPWAWIYESVFLLTGIIPWLTVTREQLRRYLTGFALLSLASFAIFVLFPVASPRPTGVQSTPFLIFITHVDGPLNAFPSLHAGCLVYNLALVKRLFKGAIHPLVTSGLWIWAILILFGTLSTKQHYALDLLAGGILGWTADWLVWRSFAVKDRATANTRCKSDATSQLG